MSVLLTPVNPHRINGTVALVTANHSPLFSEVTYVLFLPFEALWSVSLMGTCLSAFFAWPPSLWE